MGFDIISPIWLAFLPIGIPIIFLMSKGLKRKGRVKKNTAIFLRCMLITLLILVCAKIGLTWTINDTATVFLIDASDSMKGSDPATESFVKEAINMMKVPDRAGVILFGEDPVMESFLSQEPSFERIRTIVKGNYTNMERAITAGISVLPEKSRKRIVLITDGEENEGDSSKTAGILKEKGIDFKVLMVEKDKGKEAAVVNVVAPARLNKNEKYNVIVNIKSNFKTKGKLTLFDGNEKAIEEFVDISKGENKYVFSDKADSAGYKTYKAVLEADEDSDSRNNEASAIINVLDEPVILLLEGKSNDGEEIAKMLSAANLDYKRYNAEGAPTTIQSLIQYKTIILSNVSAEKLNNGFINALEPYVKDFGGGLVAVGGDDSFALGGYYKTPLEKVLPVNMELKGKKAIPDMSILLVIDKSGSMSDGFGGTSRIELAKEAASRVLDSLRDQDDIGVLAFDDSMYWVVEPQKPGDREEIRNMIGSIREGGGTSILPPLKEAVKTIKGIDSKIKHVILLTDGQAEKTGYDDVLLDAATSGITVSAVAVGHDADANLLKYISQKAGGRFYQTDEYTNLPAIFAKETFMAAKAYLNNREFVPRIVSTHPVINNVIEGGLPKLLGYVAASPKDTARVVLESDEGDPVLTLWQYGLGKTIAWNSDMSGKWSGNYVNWENNITLWNGIINWTIENYDDNELQIDTYLEGGNALIDVRQRESSEEFATKAIITTPSLDTIELKLNAEAPGQYKGVFKTGEIGNFLIKVIQSSDGEIVSSVGTGLTVPYSPEYKIDAKTDGIDRLINESGGRYIKSPKEVYEGDIAQVRGRKDLTPYLLLLAFIILLADIAVRRLNLPFEKALKSFNKLLKKIKISKKENKIVTQDDKSKESIDKKVDIKKEDMYNYKSKEEINTDLKKEEKANGKDAIGKETLNTTALLKKKRQR